MDNYYNSNIKKYLEINKDEKYKKFSSSLIPNCNNIIGVKIPILRKMAKKLSKDNWKRYLENALDDSFEEIMLQGLTIGYVNDDINNLFPYIDNYIKKIDNWSLNDSFCSSLKITKTYKKEMFKFLFKYINSHQQFEQRFVAVMLINYYLDDKYVDKVIEIYETLDNEGYYLKMAVAWGVSIMYTKYQEKTLKYLNNNTLDDFTFNKAIQKILELKNISNDEKIIIKNLKSNIRK